MSATSSPRSAGAAAAARDALRRRRKTLRRERLGAPPQRLSGPPPASSRYLRDLLDAGSAPKVAASQVASSSGPAAAARSGATRRAKQAARRSKPGSEPGGAWRCINAAEEGWQGAAPLPAQWDGSACGVFMLVFAERLSAAAHGPAAGWPPPPGAMAFSHEDMPLLRQRIAAECLRGAAIAPAVGEACCSS